MKDKIGFIGIGQCGGNIVSLFQKNNYKTFYINTSLEDIQTLNVDNYYHIQEANGCNHNRQKAINYIKSHYQNITQKIEEAFPNQEIIYLAFSKGGGTGSGISPLLLDLLTSKYKDKTFGAIAVLPDTTESVNIQLNSYNCMSQLSNIKNIGSVFILDNSKKEKQKVNIEFFKLFNDVANIPKYTSRKGNIDTSEIKELLSIRGICTIITTENNDVSSIVKSLDQSCLVYEKDKQLIYLAISSKNGVDINGLTNYFGKPYDTFLNYNDKQNIICMSGMSFPKQRIETIKSIIESQKEEIFKMVESSKNNSIKNEIKWDISLKEDVPINQNFDEIFSKY